MTPEAEVFPLRRDVTVLIAAWRAAGTIGRAVETALAQPEAAEVVVVDDCSNDDGATLAAARAADDGTGRLKILALDRNSGPAAARNAAIAASTAPWITILDSDDYYAPGRLRGLMNAASQGYVLIADDLKQFKEGDCASTAEALWFTGQDTTPVDVDFTFFMQASLPRTQQRRTEIGFVKPLMNRAFLETHAIRYDESMRLGEDFDLYARVVLAGGRMRLIPWTGYMSVMRSGSLSSQHSRHDLAQLEASDTRLLAQARNPADEQLVRRHRFFVRRRIALIDFMQPLSRGNVFRASWVMLKDPRQAPHLIGFLARVVVHKIKRRGRN